MQIKSLWLLLLPFTTTVVFSQPNKEIDTANISKKIRNINTGRWHPYIGIHVSGDAEMFYIGPSFQIGADFQLKKRITLTSYLHYYSKKVNNNGNDFFFETGKFKTLTGAVLCQINTGKSLNRSFFIAGGIAIQSWMDNYSSSNNNWDKKRITVIPAMRLGYFFPADWHKFTVELNWTGPYSYTEGLGYTTEIVTQLSLGMRFILLHNNKAANKIQNLNFKKIINSFLNS